MHASVRPTDALASPSPVTRARVAAGNEPPNFATPNLSMFTAPAAPAAVKPSRLIPTIRGDQQSFEEKGGLRVFVSKGVVRALGAKNYKEKWTATAPKDIHLARLKNSNISWVGLSSGKPRSLFSVLWSLPAAPCVFTHTPAARSAWANLSACAWVSG